MFATIDGDTVGYSGSHATYVVELIDSTTGLSVHRLDSFRISTLYRSHAFNVVDTIDLVTGTYYVRARVDTVGIAIPAINNDSRYPVGEVQMEMIDSLPMLKLRRLPRIASSHLRPTLHPNPTTGESETRFTVPQADRVRVVLSAIDGQFATTLIDEWMEAGRYAVDIDARALSPGVYAVQIHVGNYAEMMKVVVATE